MNIRKYKTEDCKEITKLFYNTVHSINSRDYNDEQIKVWAPKEIDMLVWNKSLLESYSLVVEKDNIILGFGNLHSNGYLYRIYVHKDYQNIGVATTIINELEKYSKDHSIKVITTHASITARSFFEKKGYINKKEQMVERKGQYLINFIMEKNLI